MAYMAEQRESELLKFVKNTHICYNDWRKKHKSLSISAEVEKKVKAEKENSIKKEKKHSDKSEEKPIPFPDECIIPVNDVCPRFWC